MQCVMDMEAEGYDQVSYNQSNIDIHIFFVFAFAFVGPKVFALDILTSNISFKNFHNINSKDSIYFSIN